MRRDAFAASNPCQNSAKFAAIFERDDLVHRSSDRLVGAVAIHAFGSAVPGRDDPLERSAQDGIARGIHDCCDLRPQTASLSFMSFESAQTDRDCTVDRV